MPGYPHLHMVLSFSPKDFSEQSGTRLAGMSSDQRKGGKARCCLYVEIPLLDGLWLQGEHGGGYLTVGKGCV
jgi:hypothetical protein